MPIAVVLLLALSGLSSPPDVGAAAQPGQQSNVRLLTVQAVRTGGLLENLIAAFEEESGFQVTVIPAGPDIFERARAGEADIVMVHLGHTPLQEFVSDGLGRWPATVLANAVAFLIPPGDPAGVGDAADPVEAFRSIAAHQSPFVVNDLGETRYITDALWNAAGRPDKGEWFLDLGLRGRDAVREAEERGGYTIWGLHPFLMMPSVGLEPVVFNDSLMQRIIATTVVKRAPSKLNRPGALALERFLVDPATQGDIRSFRLSNPEIGGPIFWPAGNQNDNR